MNFSRRRAASVDNAPVLIAAKVHSVGLDQIERFPSSSEVHSQIGGQDGVFKNVYDPFEFVLRHVGQDLIAFGIENHQTLVEMMVLHRRGGVQLRQVGRRLDLVRVVGTAVVQIMAQACNQKRNALNLDRAERS